MGPMTIRRKTGARHLSLAGVSSVLLATAAQSQVFTNSMDPGIGGFGNFGLNAAGPATLLTYGVDAGVGETDNVTLVPTNKISQTIATADADFTVKEQTRLLDVNAKGNFSDLNYLQGAYGNELIGRFDGQAQLAIIPERLTWVLSDDFGDATVDAFTPATPTNLQYVNYVSTGPNLYLRLGGTGFINATARYAEAYYENSPFNSNRALATLTAGLQLSSASSVSLNGAGERVMFQNTELNSDFDRSTVYGRYEAHGARTDLAANLGATTVDQQGKSTTGGIGKLELTRKLSPSARLTFTAGRELTDASSSFSTLQGGAINMINVAPTPLTSDSYVSTYASVGWQYQRNRTTVAITARWQRDRYPGNPQFDLNTGGGEFNIQRQMTRSFSAQLIGRLYKFDYLHANVAETGLVGVPPVVGANTVGSAEYNNGLIGAALVWRHGRSLEVRLRYDYNSYVVSTGNTGYRSNTVFLTVGYRPRSAAELQQLELPEPP
jgi:hypothetical protein